MIEKDISDEEYREYIFGNPIEPTHHRIYNPVKLYIGNTTHRVVDANGLVHCVPSVGQHGCVLQWKPRDPENPVAF